MNPTLNPTLESLRDIRGLDPISWWPLAPGWWVLTGILIALVVIALLIAWWVYVWHRDWRSDARQRLHELGTSVHQLGAKEATARISELLRRIAMARYGRWTCASLTGEEWLAWLNTRDPVGFPWSERGRVLIDLPYAPPRDQVRTPGSDPDNLRALVEAIFPWLEPDPTPTPATLRIRFALLANAKRG